MPYWTNFFRIRCYVRWSCAYQDSYNRRRSGTALFLDWTVTVGSLRTSRTALPPATPKSQTQWSIKACFTSGVLERVPWDGTSYVDNFDTCTWLRCISLFPP